MGTLRSRVVPAALLLSCAKSPQAPSVTAPPAPAATPSTSTAAAPDASLESLAPDAQLRGFTVVARYRDGTGRAVGGRFVHQATGFELDTLRIDSAPQAFIWVNSLPTSDAGEPHTQEHLLLGKGTVGSRVANLEEMSLAESSAFTEQWRTCYHMHTTVAASFWSVLEADLDGLLHPDYTDEEIRREVRNFGVTTKDGKLLLEEKGTVYNEMVRSYEQPDYLLWRAFAQAVYGAAHPLALSSGGWPDAIRTMTPEDIRRFHRDHYHLANMGMVASLPPQVTLDELLRRTDEILVRLAGDGKQRGPVVQMDKLPAPQGIAPGTVDAVEYPSASAANPSPLFLVWPATRELPLEEKLLLDLFLDAFAGDESTDLYKLLVDTKTRVLDTGATGVGFSASDDQGMPLLIALNDVPPKNLGPDKVREIRARVVAALGKVASLPPGSAELTAFNARVASRLVNLRRQLAKAAGSPPGFGARGASGFWHTHLWRLGREGGFERSLVFAPQLAAIEKLLGAGGNPWSERLARWQLVGVEPMALAGKPSPALLARLGKERDARVAAETARLARGQKDVAAALRAYKAEYDAKSAELEARDKAIQLPPFTDTPPMTLDDTLRVTVDARNGVPHVVASFEGMAAAEIGIAFRLDVVPEAELPYVALLPQLLDEVGIAGEGETIPYDEVNERLRKEILGLGVRLESNPRTGRVELVVAGAGNDLDEARRALVWMRRVLLAPDWRAENLPRLRDVVARSATALRSVMRGGEEGWAQGPPAAYLRQRWPLYLHAASFLTRAHDAHRLRWLLEDAGAHGGEVVAFLERLEAAAPLGRSRLEQLTAALQKKPAALPAALRPYVTAAAALPPEARALVVKAAADLGEILDDLPDASLAQDWRYLVQQIAADLVVPPADTLAALNRVRGLVVRAAHARVYAAASAERHAALAPELAALLARLDGPRAETQSYGDRPLVIDRLVERNAARGAPLFVGLVNKGTQAGLVASSVPTATYADRDDEKLVDYLAGNLYAGHGAHGLFMKTWAAGLAYSNGMRPSVTTGRLVYYAERCPRIAQTLGFVIDELKRVQPDPSLVDYAVAQAFTSRTPAAYETRAASYAADLADGVTPELVKGFRARLLELRGRKELAAALFARMEAVYGAVLPGYGPPSKNIADAVFWVAGPEAQIAGYEQWLKTVEAPDATVVRLYPRDFWVPRR